MQFKTLRVFININEKKLPIISDPSIYCLKCEPKTLRIFISDEIVPTIKLIENVRKDIENDIIEKFTISLRYENIIELKKLYVILGFFGVNRYNVDNYVQPTIHKINPELLNYLDAGYVLGSYKIIEEVRIVTKTEYPKITLLTITTRNSVYTGIINKETKEYFLIDRKTSEYLSNYIKMTQFEIPMEVETEDVFKIVDLQNKPLIVITIDKNKVRVDDKLTNNQMEMEIVNVTTTTKVIPTINMKRIVVYETYITEKIRINKKITEATEIIVDDNIEISVKMNERLKNYLIQKGYIKIDTEDFILELYKKPDPLSIMFESKNKKVKRILIA